ncbi:unnamed protein product [Rotaria sp. Silwood1]|nr:unnamed protein product [Rotaria sp. Silwood1]CAF3350688.1 unnamed protein product [Rotaria sp. Silwood1]CAF4577425.1 unnamed protein product [Rotaria sp. Silwood1]
MTRNDIAICLYGDRLVPIRMLNLKDKNMTGNMLRFIAINLLRARDMNVTLIHVISKYGNLHSSYPTFVQCCQIKFVRIDGWSVTELCPYLLS